LTISELPSKLGNILVDVHVNKKEVYLRMNAFYIYCYNSKTNWILQLRSFMCEFKGPSIMDVRTKSRKIVRKISALVQPSLCVWIHH